MSSQYIRYYVVLGRALQPHIMLKVYIVYILVHFKSVTRDQ